ncbi:MAG: AAA family ATPase [Breznakibacter sp.]
MSNEKPTSQEGENKDKPKLPKFNLYWIYGAIFFALIIVGALDYGKGPVSISYSDFENRILKGDDIKEVVVIRNTGIAEITLKPESIDKYKDLFEQGEAGPDKNGPHFKVTLPSLDEFKEVRNKAIAEGHSVPLNYKDEKNRIGDIFYAIWPFLLLAVVWIFIFRRMNGGGGAAGGGNIFNVGKSRAKVFDKESSINVTFKDVAGLAEAKTELEEIVEFLKRPEKYTELGGKIPKGALLVGPPGTGKTLLAKAVAGEANVPFFSMSGSDFVEMFVGVGASRVRDLFKQAKQKSPCIIFIDEIDAIGRARGKNANFGANDERENTLNQLLTEMDGFATNSGVIILAATNRADILDRALMRAGRFDRQIQVELPDLNERQEIFRCTPSSVKVGRRREIGFLGTPNPRIFWCRHCQRM